VSFALADRLRVAMLDVAVFCADGHDQTVGEGWEIVDSKLSEQTYERMMREGIPYTARVPVAGEARFVEVVVYDRRGATGSAAR
jgi:hypothetical protein